MSLLTEALKSGICPVCEQSKTDIDTRYSFGYYAGVMCVDCARRGFRDQCGLRPEGQGSPQELDDFNNDGQY